MSSASIPTYRWIIATAPPTNSVSRQFKNFSANPFRNLLPFLPPSVFTPAGRSSWCSVRAKRKKSLSEPLVKPSIVEEVSEDEDSEEFDDGGVILDRSIVDEVSEDDDDDDEKLLEDEGDDDVLYEFPEEEPEPSTGDGGGGGGISLAGNTWDTEALAIAEEVASLFNGELGIYAFKTLQNSGIRVRIERLTNKSGSPSMEDIDAFSSAYREKLSEAEAAGSIPDVSLEVSSPGVERVVRIPEDLDRFKDRKMYVRYMIDGPDPSSPSVRDGVFRLVTLDMEQRYCTWALADVKVNREKAGKGKGRPLNKKQKEWRLVTPFESLSFIRFYADF